MPYTITEFQRPDPSTVYEELDPIIIVPGDPIVVVDPNDPPVVTKGVNCCKCQEGIGGCSPEQIDGTKASTNSAKGFAYYFA